jgi:hypothetical protein
MPAQAVAEGREGRVQKKKKKKRARSAEAAKKKGCKKKKATATTRATLTWSPSSVDLDLLAWDTSGLKSPSPGISKHLHTAVRWLAVPRCSGTCFRRAAASSPTGSVPTASPPRPRPGRCTVLSASGNTQTASIVTEGAQFDSDGDNYRVTYSNPSSFNPGPGALAGGCS